MVIFICIKFKKIQKLDKNFLYLVTMRKLENFINCIFENLYFLPQFILRLFLGIAFIIHGFNKFPLPPQKLIKYFNFSPTLASFVSLSEIFAGVLLILSFFIKSYLGSLLTRLSAAIIVIIMICAFYFAHQDWFITKELFISEQIFLFALGFYFLIVGNKKIK